MINQIMHIWKESFEISSSERVGVWTSGNAVGLVVMNGNYITFHGCNYGIHAFNWGLYAMITLEKHNITSEVVLVFILCLFVNTLLSWILLVLFTDIVACLSSPIGFQFDYVFDWTILKYQQSQIAGAPSRTLVNATYMIISCSYIFNCVKCVLWIKLGSDVQLLLGVECGIEMHLWCSYLPF